MDRAKDVSTRATKSVVETIVIRPRAADKSKEKLLKELEEVKAENTTLREEEYSI